MSAAPVYEYIPREQLPEVFARVAAARTEPVPDVPAEGECWAVSPLEPCERCGVLSVFTRFDDGATRLVEILKVRTNGSFEPGQAGWLESQDVLHDCAERAATS